MRRPTITNTLIVCVTVAVMLVLLEVVVRVGSETDADGRLYFAGHVLNSAQLPVNQLGGKVMRYIENQNLVTTIYHRELGWVYRPKVVRKNGQFTVNSQGIRSKREYSKNPVADTLRIALFGDSFTAAVDVWDEESWGYQLERELEQAGIRSEILNFGVGGYGMGQAFLRWQAHGRHYDPDIVIFGFQPENLNRNVNIFHGLYNDSEDGNPLSKPRFVWTDYSLQLVNSPTILPEQIIPVFESFADHELSDHEYYFPGRITKHCRSFSYLFEFLCLSLVRNEGDAGDYGLESERGMLGTAIVDEFAEDVNASDAAFMVVFLPYRNEVKRHIRGHPSPYRYMIDYLQEKFEFVSPVPQFNDDHIDKSYWSNWHYGPEMNSIVADVVANKIATCVRDSTCDLPRFEDRSLLFITD